VLKRVFNLIEFACAILYSVVLRFTRKRPARVILYYHGVSRVFAEDFRRQMAYLARECRVVKPCDIVSMTTEGNRTIVAVTFDDAFVSVLENALPVLREYGLPAGISVPTGNIGRRPDWPMAPDCPDKDDIVMNEPQIAALDREGFEILSHTVSHPALTDLNEAELEVELTKSRQDLEHIVGHDVSAICYPYGAYDARVHSATRKAGYTLGFTIDPGIVDGTVDCLRIGRFVVSPRDNLTAFRLKANGAYQVVRPLRSLKRMLVRSGKAYSEKPI